MFNKKQIDLCVIGAGPVGLVAAHALADRKANFVQLDTAAGPHIHSYALALLPKTMELLDSIGVAEKLLKHARKVPRIAVYEGAERKLELDYSRLNSKFPHLTVVRQCTLERVLVETLRQKGHKPLWHHRARFIHEEKNKLGVEVDRLMEGMTGYAFAHIEMQIDKMLQYDADYVIGADGHQSVARRVSDFSFDEVGPSQSYAVFEFKTDAALPDEMRIIVEEEKTHIFWPMPDNCCRWSFEVPEDQAPVETMNKEHFIVYAGNKGFSLVDDAHLAGFVSRTAPWFKGSVENMRWRMLVHFEKRITSSFGKKRIWLAGDAAHLTAPGGMLSMNIGMHEAYDLVQRLTMTSNELRDLALTTYDEERKQEWNDLLCLDHVLCGDTADPWLLQHKDQLAANLPASGDIRAALLKQLHLESVAV